MNVGSIWNICTCNIIIFFKPRSFFSNPICVRPTFKIHCVIDYRIFIWFSSINKVLNCPLKCVYIGVGFFKYILGKCLSFPTRISLHASKKYNNVGRRRNCTTTLKPLMWNVKLFWEKYRVLELVYKSSVLAFVQYLQIVLRATA